MLPQSVLRPLGIHTIPVIKNIKKSMHSIIMSHAYIRMVLFSILVFYAVFITVVSEQVTNPCRWSTQREQFSSSFPWRDGAAVFYHFICVLLLSPPSAICIHCLKKNVTYFIQLNRPEVQKIRCTDHCGNKQCFLCPCVCSFKKKKKWVDMFRLLLNVPSL